MDNHYDLLRILCGTSAVIGGAVLLFFLAIGRSSFAARTARRAEDPKGYWLAVLRIACTVAGWALAAFVAKDKQLVPVVCLSVFLPNLLLALTSGRFDWEAVDKRIDSPRRFWGWVAFYGLMSAMMIVFLIWP